MIEWHYDKGGVITGYSLALKGGEKRDARERAISHALEVFSKEVGDLPLMVTGVQWYRRKQHRASSVRYIAVAHDSEGNKWIARIVQGKDSKYVDGREVFTPFTEVRSVHPLKVPCKQVKVPLDEVPYEVTQALKGVFSTTSSKAMRLMFML
jgi:hypothetical protein